MKLDPRSKDELQSEIESLKLRLEESLETIDAIRNGEVDALIVNGKNGHELFTLKSADHTYRIFIEKMSEGAVTVNENGVIVYCNSSFAGIVGQEASALIAESFGKFVAEDEREKFDNLFAEAWRHDVKSEIGMMANNKVTPVQLSLTTLTMDEGLALSIIVTDLTNQKETLRLLRMRNDQLAEVNLALELSNHDLQQFASVASHDLQEPLRKIQIFSHLLAEKFSSSLPVAAQEYLSKIVSSSSRMKVLIVDILNYSRLSSNDNQFEKTDLAGLIRELLQDLEMTISEKDAIITVGEMPILEVNAGQMRQVFQNLISNALKFSRINKRAEIEIFCTDTLPGFETTSPNWCHVHIRDNGIGFDEKYSKNIFNLFEKLHSKDEYEGTGIGLAITKKIIEKHKGFITVNSEEGSGTEFVLSIPKLQNPNPMV